MKTVLLKVPNMKCMACAIKIERNLIKLLGVEVVNADIDSKNVSVIYNGNPEVLKEVLKNLKNLGYPAEQ